MKIKFRSVITHPAFILLTVAILTYWPLSFMVETLKWDMLDVVFPWRHFVGESLQNGIFPFWNPYQATGYPIHADLQCPTFFPELWIVGILTGYSIYIMHLLFVFYIFIAGYGMFHLTYFFNHKKAEAILAGISFMLCGFFVSHGQHFFAIVGGAFIPFVLLYYIKTLVQPGLKHTLLAAVFIFLLVTGGYQPLSIITAYLLLTVFLFYFIKRLKQKQSLSALLKYQLLLGLLVLLLLLTVLIPVIQVSGFSGRLTQGLSLQKALYFPFTPQSLISLLLPFSTVKNPEFFKTDFSMNNLYFGLLMFIVFIYGLLKSKKGIEKILLGFGLISLLASFGHYLPIRKLMFSYLPFMNQFRMPAYFSYFTVFSFVLSAGIHLPGFLNSFQKKRKQILLITLPILLFFLGILFFSFPKIYFRESAFVSYGFDIKEIFKHSTFYEHLFLQSFIQLIVLGCFLFALLKSKSRESFKRLFVFLAVFEMVVSVNLNGTFTVWSPPSPGQIHHTLSANPKGFPLPDLNNKIRDNGDLEMKQDPLWRNMGNWTKQVSFDAFSSFPADRYQILDDSLPELRDAVLNNPVVYTSAHILPYDSLKQSDKGKIKSKNIYLAPGQYRKLSGLHLKDSKEDRIRMLVFQPGDIYLEYETRDSTLLNLLQSDYKGWKVFLDDQPVSHFTGNYLYISTLVPSGKHRVRFIYENRAVHAGFLISCSLLFLILLVLSYFWGNEKSNRNKILFPLVVFLFALLLILLYKYRTPVSEKKKYTSRQFAEQLQQWEEKFGSDSLTIIINTDDSAAFTSLINHSHPPKYMQMKSPRETGDFYDLVEQCGTPWLVYGNIDLYEPSGTGEMIRLEYPCKVEELKGYHSYLTLFRRESGCRKSLPVFQAIQNHESYPGDWIGEPAAKDTSCVLDRQFSFRLDSTHIYSPAFGKRFAELGTPGKCFFVINADAWVSRGATPFLVFQTKRKGNLKQWHSLDISKFIHYRYESREKLVYVVEVNRNIKKNEKVEIYVWDKEGKPVWIDRLRIRVYPIR